MKVVAIVVLVSTTFMAGGALACSCLETYTPEEMFDVSDAVFSGVVVDIVFGGLDCDTGDLVTLSLTGCWKGGGSPQLVIATPSQAGCCRSDFMVGEECLVYALNLNVFGVPNGFLNTHLCTRTALLVLAQEDLDWLGPAGPGCTVPLEPSSWGRIKAIYQIDS